MLMLNFWLSTLLPMHQINFKIARDVTKSLSNVSKDWNDFHQICPWMLRSLFFHLLVRTAVHSAVTPKHRGGKYGPSAVYVPIPSPLNIFHWLFLPQAFLKEMKQSFFPPLMANSTVYCAPLVAAERHNMATKPPHNRALFGVEPFS